MQSTSCRSYDIHYENDIKKTRSSQHPAEAMTYIMKMTLKNKKQSTYIMKMTLKRQEAVNILQKL